MAPSDQGPHSHPRAKATPEFLRLVLENIANPVFAKDREYRFVFVNEAFARVAGRPVDEILGRTDHDLLPRQEADFLRLKDVELFTTGVTLTAEAKVFTAQGEPRVVESTVVPVRGGDGEITHIVGVVHDITALKEAEQALRMSTAELERRVTENTVELKRAQQQLLHKERLTVLGQLAAGLAHQLRNPLASITNAASIIENRLQTESQDSRIALSIIKEEVQVANQIITDLLDYARVRPPIPQEIVLRDLVDSVLDSQQVPASISVQREVPLELSLVVDGDQLRGALRNVVRNSIEAMLEGGTLAIVAAQVDDEIRILVRDSGEGIPAELRQHMFDPLVSSKPLGLGLGLTTARTLAQNQGGRLAYVDEEAEGATFELAVPLEPPPRSSQLV